ncbi:NACHT domain-containing protein [Paramagnetospirillum magneticum]|nr:NACHT domain-containing protein [Paramagnetospirillum magneticum]
MDLIATLTLKFGPKLAKAIAKLWLPKDSAALAAADDIAAHLSNRGEDFTTAQATRRLFDHIVSDIVLRLGKLIDAEFRDVSDNDREAAILAVGEAFESLSLSADMMRSELNGLTLEQRLARPEEASLQSQDGRTQDLAELLLRESCAYAVTVAAKLPDFSVPATRELLKRTLELSTELVQALDKVEAMRDVAPGNDLARNFEAQYRRAVAQRLDRMQLFGVRLIGAGAREPEISVAYVTLTSSRQDGTPTSDVDSALEKQTRVIVRGEAGSGKTTLLQWLAIRAANRDFEGVLAPWNARMPFYVYLRDHAEGQFPAPEQLVAGIDRKLVGLMPSGWARQALADGALLLIDGIDEVPVARRAKLLEWLKDLTETFPDAVLVLSSRPAALDAKLSHETTRKRLTKLGFEQIILEPMSLADSEALIIQWHRAVGRDLTDTDDRAKLERFEQDLIRTLRDRPAIRHLASNPLLCSMICVLNWDRQQLLPDNRMELYGLALTMLIEGATPTAAFRPPACPRWI